MIARNIKQLLSNEYLVVPEIQREYVWGSLSNIEKLKSFISDIDISVKSENKNIGFLYTYHSKENECYIIDGQQRMTTIILLLYVLAQKEGDSSWEKFSNLILSGQPKLKFSYNVRPLTEEFLRNIFSEREFGSKELIKDKRWYINAYNDDKTIDSILGAIDTIQNMELCITFEEVLEKIEFWYFKVEETSQGEELYISMNSRGRKLAKGEMIKPLLLKKENHKETYEKKWDTWEDWFFSIRKDVGEDINIDCVDEYSIPNLIKMAIELSTYKIHRDIIPIVDAELPELNLHYLDELVEELRKCIENKLLAYKDLSVLYSDKRELMNWFQIEILLASKNSIIDIKEKARLLRIIKNSVTYNPKSRENAFLDFVSLIKKKPQNISLYEYIYNNREEVTLKKIDNDKTIGFIPTDEIEKIAYLMLNEDKEKLIIEAENFAFFDGRIHFLYHNENGNVDWNNFENKYIHAKQLFNKSGITEEYKNKGYLIRLLVSYFDKWEYFSSIIYDLNKDTIHNILLDKSLQGPVSKMLLTDNFANLDDFQSHYNFTENQKQLQEEIVCTTWVKDISEGSYLRNSWEDGNYHFLKYNGKTNWRHYFLVNKRNYIINTLVKKRIITTEYLMASGFCWGDFVYFEYNNMWFKWTSGNHIYLCPGKDKNPIIRKQSSNIDSNNKRYFMLDVSMETDTITILTEKLESYLNIIIEEYHNNK